MLNSRPLRGGVLVKGFRAGMLHLVLAPGAISANAVATIAANAVAAAHIQGLHAFMAAEAKAAATDTQLEAAAGLIPYSTIPTRSREYGPCC